MLAGLALIMLKRNPTHHGDRSAKRPSRSRLGLNFYALAMFMALCFFFGGASRADALSQTVVRIAAVLLIAFSLLRAKSDEMGHLRIPMLLFSSCASLALLQLIPLPPSIWERLPGHRIYGELTKIIGVSGVWRPMTLTPALTLNSLFSLLPAFATVIGMNSVRTEQWHRLIPVLLCGVALSVLIGLIQLTGGPNSSAYWYEVTNRGFPVGLFANRNHQAILIALCFPMLTVWATERDRSDHTTLLRKSAAVSVGLALIPFALLTASRAGLIVGALGLIFSLLLLRRDPRERPILQSQGARFRRVLPYAMVAAAAGLIVLVAVGSREQAFQRLSSVSFESDQRFAYIPTMIRMVGDYLPLGAGLGSFDTVFRSHEPVEKLSLQYFNHAHNDLLELAIETGVAGIVILGTFLIWAARRASFYWRKDMTRSSASQLGRVGAVVLLMLLVSSFVDYPLRTPIHSMIFAICCCWLCTPLRALRSANGATGPTGQS